MAAGRNPDIEREYRAEVARFLRGIYDNAGYRSQAQLAKDVNVEASRVSHWLNGTGEGRGPSAYNMLQVIRAAEARKEGSVVPEVPPVQSDAQRDLAAAAEEIVKEMKTGFRKLDRRLLALEKRLPREENQSPAKGAQADRR